MSPLKVFLHFVFHYAWSLHEGILYKFIPCIELVYPNPSSMLSKLLMFKKSMYIQDIGVETKRNPTYLSTNTSKVLMSGHSKLLVIQISRNQTTQIRKMFLRSPLKVKTLDICCYMLFLGILKATNICGDGSVDRENPTHKSSHNLRNQCSLDQVFLLF